MISVEHRWSGQVLEPVDSLAFIGRNPLDHENVYVVTGDSGNGLTHGTIAGMLLADLITGRPNRWASLYDPKRCSLRAATKFARANLDVAAQYAALATAGEVDGMAEIAPGEGAVVRHELAKHAVFRDHDGALYAHSGCVVAWNARESSWDCPCHGSRFDRHDGYVLNGPAARGLAAVDEADAAPLSPSRRDRGASPARHHRLDVESPVLRAWPRFAFDAEDSADYSR